MASGSRKRKKKTAEQELEEATDECLELLEGYKKPKKSCHFQFHRNPRTGRRKSYNVYRPRFAACSTSNVDDTLDDGNEVLDINVGSGAESNESGFDRNYFHDLCNSNITQSEINYSLSFSCGCCCCC